jgi:hypothetical protein
MSGSGPTETLNTLNSISEAELMKKLFYAVLTLTLATSPAFATVNVSSPSNGATVSSGVQFVGTATASGCPQGVAAVGVYVDNQLRYTANGSTLNTTLPLPAGTHRTVAQEWDYCGNASGTERIVTVSSQSGVFVTAPADSSTVSNPASFVASAASSCNRGVSAMGVYVDNQLVYVAQGAKLNTQLNLGPGTRHVVVQEWDNCGGASASPLTVKVQEGSAGQQLSNIQAMGGWNSWGELAPSYNICNGPCGGVTWGMTQHESSVSLSGNATRFDIGGTTPYSDVLWSNPIMGQGSASMPDTDRKIIPNLHNFTYNADVFITNASVTQDLEFDVNMYLDGVGMEWGTECNHLADGDWDIWDNVNGHWVSTGAPCNLINNAWNHVTLQVQREADNTLLYQTISLNGVTYNINKTMAPFQVPYGWYGMTVNFQMDGNYRQSPNTTYLDNFNLNYW